MCICVPPQGVKEPPLWLLITVKVRDFCFILNSAVNIVIYTSLSEEFRGELRSAFNKFFRGTFVFTGRPRVPPTSSGVVGNTFFLTESAVRT